jgi:PEP-CTERM motif-containing protein
MKRSVFNTLFAVSLLVAVMPANASLTLTAAGISDGFTLTTFLSGYSAQYGPLAQGIAPNGNVITGSLLNTSAGFGPTIMVFKDVDGQHLTDALFSPSYTCITGNCNFAMTTAGGQVYGAQAQGGVYEHFNSDGSFSPIPNLVAAGLFDNLGMWGDPVNGHIITTSSKGLVDIDPITGTFRVINASVNGDGVSVSPNGTTAYVEVGGQINSYNIATGALLATYAAGSAPDGTGVISGGKFNGDVVVNGNFGTVGLLDPTTSSFVIIANGGTRGDFVSPDSNNGSLFLSQNEAVDRLTCGPGCSFTPPPTPEPSTFALFGMALASVALIYRRRKI